MHCLEPTCVQACPVDALKKTDSGPVIYDDTKCIGCRYCMMACPFGAPTFEWNKTVPWIRKCTFCSERLSQNQPPSCIEICPTNALQFGERSELISEAHKRIADNPDKYIDHVYGENENGGTSWLMLSPAPFDSIALPTLDSKPVGTNAVYAMSVVPPVAITIAIAMTGLYWLTKKRDKAVNKNSEVER